MKNKKKLIKNLSLILAFIFFILIFVSIIFHFKIPVSSSLGAIDGNYPALKTGDKIEVEFTSKIENIESIYLRMVQITDYTFDSNNKDEIYISVYHDGDLIYYNELKKADLQANSALCLKFNRINNSVDSKFKIVIDVKKITEGINYEFYAMDTVLNKQDSASQISTYINGEKSVTNLYVEENGYGSGLFYKIVFLVLSNIFLFIFFRLQFFDNLKIKDKIRNKNMYIVIEALASIVMVVSMFMFVYESYYLSNTPRFFTVLFVFSTYVINFILALFVGDKKTTIPKLFLLFVIPIGLSFIVFMLPLKFPDALYHYKIAYQLASGNFSMNKSFVPQSIYTLYNDVGDYYTLRQFFDINDYNNLIQISTGKYNPIFYIPSALGIFVCKTLNLAPIFGVYAASLINFSLFIVIGYYILKSIPFGKMLFMIYLLNPLMIQQSISLSIDNLINLSALLFIAYVFYLKYKKDYLKLKDYIILLVSAMFFIVGKYVYFPLLLLLILIKDKFKKLDKKKIKYIILTIIIILAICFGWELYYKFVISGDAPLANYVVPQSSSSKLMTYIKAPLRYFYSLITTLIANIGNYFIQFAGGNLASLNVSIPFYILYLIILALGIFMDNDKEYFDKKAKIISIIISFITINLVIAGIAISWGNVNDIIITGVQARYFYPFIILVLFCLITKKTKNIIKSNNIIIPLSIFAYCFLTISEVIINYV